MKQSTNIIEEWPFEAVLSELKYDAKNKTSTMLSIGYKFIETNRINDFTPKNMMFKRQTFSKPKTRQVQRAMMKDGLCSFTDITIEGKIQRNVRAQMYYDKIIRIKIYQVVEKETKIVESFDINFADYIKYEKKDVSLKLKFGTLICYIGFTKQPPPMEKLDVVETKEEIMNQIDMFNNDIEEINDTLVEGYEVKQLLLEKLRVLKMFKINPGDLYPEESDFVINEIYLHVPRYNDDQKPILGSLIIKHIVDNKLFNYKMESFFKKIIEVLNILLRSTMNDAKLFVYYFTSTVNFLESVKRFQPQTHLEKQQSEALINPLLKLINTYLKQLYDQIVKSSDGRVINFFLDTKEIPSMSMTFSFFFEVVRTMVRDKIHKTVFNHFFDSMLRHIDILIYNKIMSMKTIPAEYAFEVKQRKADFISGLQNQYKQKYDNVLPITTSTCDIISMDIGCLRIDDLKYYVTPELSYNQVFAIADKRDPPPDQYFYNQLKGEAMRRSFKASADLNDKPFQPLTIEKIFGI